MPESFMHRWDYVGGKPTLMIDFPEEERQISQQKMEDRQQKLKKLLIEETFKHHQKYVQDQLAMGDSDPILRSDPLRS
jgi:hypothetical protein